MIAWLAPLTAWIPFIHPAQLPAGARLWMFLPLAACVAIVYRVTRAKSVGELPRAALKTFATIVIGMCLIAATAYALHAGVLHFSEG